MDCTPDSSPGFLSPAFLAAKIDADPDWIRLTSMEEGLPLDTRRMEKKGAAEDFGFTGSRNSGGL